MEIKVTIDGAEASQRGGATGPATSASQDVGEPGGGPPAEVAAAAAAIGAIDAGPAHIPPGESGQALANIAAISPMQAVGGQQSAQPAGAAPEYTREVEEVVPADGEIEG